MATARQMANSRLQLRFHTYAVHNQVWLRDSEPHKQYHIKFVSFWLGHWRIMEQVSRSVWQIQSSNGRPRWAHSLLLQPYHWRLSNFAEGSVWAYRGYDDSLHGSNTDHFQDKQTMHHSVTNIWFFSYIWSHERAVLMVRESSAAHGNFLADSHESINFWDENESSGGLLRPTMIFLVWRCWKSCDKRLSQPNHSYFHGHRLHSNLLFRPILKRSIMSSDANAKRMIACLFGVCSGDQFCPHAVQVALPTVRVGAWGELMMRLGSEM